MKKVLLAVVISLGIVATTNAAYINGKYPVCMSEDAFDRLSSIIEHNDTAAYEKIMKSDCLFLKEGTPIEKVVSQGWASGVAHVKIYVSGEFYDVWTNTENLKAGKME
ncbi:MULTISPECIES: hypothetical protein [Photorhabdus]|uniref:DUF4440 domain-containing protein n=2 Tax=Photorhabdus TaxID=29487 RepID=A0AAW6BNX4_9GAMM|nr:MULTISPECIES: hypothetical protein [Photorhabdus]MDB6374516.1 hypothetical protein [Photorhabdus bodei]